MRVWRVFEVEGKPVNLEIALNKIQKDGFEIFSTAPKSFGFLVIAYIDHPGTSS